MQILKCLIIEDEPLAAEVIQDYVKAIPFLETTAICTDAIYALEQLRQHPIDVLFLDLHLPKLKGFDFLKTLHQSPQVIVTTAYHQYALESYDLEVVDYLLKPIEFERFLKAVNRLKISHLSQLSAIQQTTSAKRPYRFFNVNKKKIKIYLDDICYIESLKEYVKIVTVNKSVVTKFQLGELHHLLGNTAFLRIHRSYIVAKKHIEAYTNHSIDVKDVQLPIGRSYLMEVMGHLSM